MATKTQLQLPDKRGRFGAYGGRYVPETLVSPIVELERAFHQALRDAAFQRTFHKLLRDFAGRPTLLYKAERLSRYLGGARIYLKREDLLHTGAHKINNCLGQGLLAKQMGKKRVIAETGAGQHGVATATVAAHLELECTVYMGAVDMERQRLNVARMRMLGAEVIGVDSGSRTLKDAINEAMRDWVASVGTTHYLLGSVLGPHPYPVMVRDFHRIIGVEARQQILKHEKRLPDLLLACVGGGSNSIGLFHAFLGDEGVAMVGVEAGGRGTALGEHAARLSVPERKKGPRPAYAKTTVGRPGVLHGTHTYVLQDKHGQIAATHSVSAGLDYPAVGPEHAHLHEIGRVQYTSATDDEAVEAARLLAMQEGIIPALESAHALAEIVRRAPKMRPDQLIVVNLSGRGDKDMEILAGYKAGNG